MNFVYLLFFGQIDRYVHLFVNCVEKHLVACIQKMILKWKLRDKKNIKSLHVYKVKLKNVRSYLSYVNIYFNVAFCELSRDVKYNKTYSSFTCVLKLALNNISHMNIKNSSTTSSFCLEINSKVWITPPCLFSASWTFSISWSCLKRIYTNNMAIIQVILIYDKWNENELRRHETF